MDQMCESMDKNRIQGVSVGRAGNLPRSPYPSRMRNVDSATVHRRQSAERNLRTEAGEAGGNPQAGRWGAKAWHPDGTGSIDPASGHAGSATALGSELL